MTTGPQRGRIPPPNLDDRTWQDLVDQMRALIPQYAPGWTDHNPSDLGITLIELFAWLTEGVIYRINQVPDKSYIAFLNLLGITRDPPSPAHTYLTFDTGTAGDVPAGTQVSTVPAKDQPPVVFQTDESVRVLPVTLDTVLQVGPFATGAGTAQYHDLSAAFAAAPTAKTVITLPPGQTVQLCLGLTDKPAEPLQLGVRLFQPLPSGVSVSWVYSAGATEPLAWATPQGLQDGTLLHPPDGSAPLPLGQDGAITFAPPADWGAQRAAAPPAGAPVPTWTSVTPATAADARTDARYWLGVRLVNATTVQSAVGIDRLLLNAAHATAALTVRTPEILGVADGSPFQSYLLRNRPLYQQPDLRAPFGDLTVEVGTGTPTAFQAWTALDDLPPGPGQVYRFDPVVGEITFGDYDPQSHQGNGSIPAAGSTIRATYRYVASGSTGNVAAGTLVVFADPAAASPVTGVTNLAPAVDGSDEESVGDTLRRAPQQLKTRDRAVTADDYEILAGEPNKSLAVVRCLPPRLQVVDGPGTPPAWRTGDPWTFAGIIRAPGSVNVVVIPDQGATVPRPEPTPELIDEVRAYLDLRRDLGVQLQVVGPRYLPISVQAQVVIWQQANAAGATVASVRADTLQRIAAFLHPTRGGPDGTGWQVGQAVYVSDLFQAVMPDPDVGYLATLQVRPGIPAYHYPPLNPSGTDSNFNAGLERPFGLSGFGASVRLADYEVVCAADQHDVQPVVSDS
jgi:predicted phage baseplate assembly protein